MLDEIGRRPGVLAAATHRACSRRPAPWSGRDVWSFLSWRRWRRRRLAVPLTPVAAQEDDEGGESVRGTLVDRRGHASATTTSPSRAPRSPWSTADGEEVGTATTDEEGQFELELPGPGDYVAELDTDTLPEGVGIAEGDEVVDVHGPAQPVADR